MLRTEDELIRASQQGDRQAFGELYDAYIHKLYTFIYYKTSRKEIAEDIASTVFMKALLNINTYTATEQGSFAGWLYAIARHAIIDYYRSIRPNETIDDTFDLPSHAHIVEDTEHQLQLEKIHAYLKTLPSLKRDIILMRVWQELPYKTIAVAVGKTEDNCKMIYSRSIKDLRIALTGILTLILISLPHIYGH